MRSTRSSDPPGTATAVVIFGKKALQRTVIGQIVQVARIHAGEHWKTLTIPRGGSEQFNKANLASNRNRCQVRPLFLFSGFLWCFRLFRRRLGVHYRNLERGRSHIALFPIRERKRYLGVAVACFVRNPHGAVEQASSAAAQRCLHSPSLGLDLSRKFNLYHRLCRLRNFRVIQHGEGIISESLRAHNGVKLEWLTASNQP
jgi:hypothetical protein